MSSELKDAVAIASDEQVRDDFSVGGASLDLGESAGATDDAPEAREEWWFALGEKAIGPVSVRNARELWADGVLTPDTPCWHEGFATWVSLFRVTQLTEALAPRRELRPFVDSAASFIRRVKREADVRPITPAVEAEPAPGPDLAAQRAPEAAPEVACDDVELDVRGDDASFELPVALVAASAPIPEPRPEPERGGAGEDEEVELDDFVSPYVELPVAPAEAVQPRGGLRHALVSGLVAGSMLVAAVVAVRVFWPLPPPPQPIVIYVREPAPPKPLTPKLTRAKAKPKVAPAAESRKPTPKAKRNRVDEWFAREFAPRR